jgi:hypothetical protein
MVEAAMRRTEQGARKSVQKGTDSLDIGRCLTLLRQNWGTNLHNVRNALMGWMCRIASDGASSGNFLALHERLYVIGERALQEHWDLPADEAVTQLQHAFSEALRVD